MKRQKIKETDFSFMRLPYPNNKQEGLIIIMCLKNKYRLLFELSPVGIALVDYKTDKFLEVNDAMLRSSCYSKDEFLKLNFWKITSKIPGAQKVKQICELNKTGRFDPHEKEFIRRDGSSYPVLISGFLLPYAKERQAVWCIIEDISGNKANMEEMKRLALYDSLTNLPNRLLLSDRLQQAIAQCQRDNSVLAVLLLELDKFKLVNDTLGHDIGDLLLSEVGKRVVACINRKTDTIARIGGDEFIVLLPHLNTVQGATLVAKKICTAIEQPFCVEGHSLDISSSIGIAIFAQHGEDEKTLRKNADAALYQVKNSGCNGYKLFDHGYSRF